MEAREVFYKGVFRERDNNPGKSSFGKVLGTIGDGRKHVGKEFSQAIERVQFFRLLGGPLRRNELGALERQTQFEKSICEPENGLKVWAGCCMGGDINRRGLIKEPRSSGNLTALQSSIGNP